MDTSEYSLTKPKNIVVLPRFNRRSIIHTHQIRESKPHDPNFATFAFAIPTNCGGGILKSNNAQLDPIQHDVYQNMKGTDSSAVKH